MEFIVGKKYRCMQPIRTISGGISGKQAIQGCYKNIITCHRIDATGIQTRENGWWIKKEWLLPLTKVIKYNKDTL